MNFGDAAFCAVAYAILSLAVWAKPTQCNMKLTSLNSRSEPPINTGTLKAILQRTLSKALNPQP